MRHFWLVTMLVASGGDGPSHEHVQLGLRLPAGFEVTQFADSQLANDIYSLTIDPRGRVVVSGRGYVRILLDDHADGRADRAVDFADGPADGAMGLLWEGTSLFVTGDGGLRRYRDDDGDDRADGPPELIRKLKTGGEHDAHDIVRGPDGWLYLLCGNMTGVNRSFAQLDTSPITEPVAGCVVRFTPDLKRSEVVADGFRNAYRMAFNPDGELFTYDSDNERCVSLPWYEPTRFYHVIAGGHYGWLSPQRAQWWRLPPYCVDVIAPAAYLGRGSPTGLECYDHVTFPAEYRGGMFAADWTFGRVYFLPLRRAGATYTSEPRVFIESVGENGFAPTDLVVHAQTGDLFVSIGGRGTRGAVYRVRYTAGEPRHRGERAARPSTLSLDWHESLATSLPSEAASGDALARLRALVGMRRHRVHFDAVQLDEAVRANWNHADRYVRTAAADLIASLDERTRRALGEAAASPREQATYALATHAVDPSSVAALAAKLLGDANDPALRLEAVRLLQLAWGDLGARDVLGSVWEGYTLRRGSRAATPSATRQGDSGNEANAAAAAGSVEAGAALRQAFPSGHADLDRELARTLAAIEDDDPAVLRKVANQLTATSHPVDDIHYLAVLARLRSPRPSEITARVARTLLALDRKTAGHKLNRDRHWPLRIEELHARLAERDSRLNDALLADAEFGRSDHVLFASCPGFNRERAAEVFLARAETDRDFAWSPALVELIGSLPAEVARPVLRERWENFGLQAAILRVLARDPQAADRPRFVAGLRSADVDLIRACLDAIEQLPREADDEHLVAAVQTLRRLGQSPAEKRLRDRIGRHLAWATGRTGPEADADQWTKWLADTHPHLASRLNGAGAVDAAGWRTRLGRVDWSSGQAARGRRVYDRAGCAACHSSGRALGPDLRGAAARFSRDDLFTAILEPARDVSPQYQTTLVATADGKMHQGSIIYEAVDGVILQTGPDAVVGIAGDEIAERRVTQGSLMPAGLLDKLADQDIADLYAYLRELR